MEDMVKILKLRLGDKITDSEGDIEYDTTDILIFKILDRYVLIATDLFSYQYTKDIAEIIGILDNHLLTVNHWGGNARLVDYSSHYKLFSLTKDDAESILQITLGSECPHELEDWLEALNVVNGEISKEVFYSTIYR